MHVVDGGMMTVSHLFTGGLKCWTCVYNDPENLKKYVKFMNKKALETDMTDCPAVADSKCMLVLPSELTKEGIRFSVVSVGSIIAF